MRALRVALLLSLLLSLWSASFSFSLDQGLKQSWERELRYAVKENARYQFGGKSLTNGVDCSWLMFLTAHKARFPALVYTQSIDMARGYGGWFGVDIKLCDIDQGDLVFWTFKPKPGKQLRPNGHVAAMFLGSQSRLPELIHASSSRGVVSVPPFDWEHITTIRHLTIGDKK